MTSPPPPVSVEHSFYVSRLPNRPTTENDTHPTRFPNFPHTIYGRGDSVSHNSISTGTALSNSQEMTNAVFRLFALNFLPQVPLREEAAALSALGEATWTYLINQHDTNAPQWIMSSHLARHMLLRPWIAYRIDVAAGLLRKPKASKPEPQEESFQKAATAFLSAKSTTPDFNSIVSSKDSRCGLVFGSVVNLRTVVSLSYTRDSFSSRAGLASWLENFWASADWTSIGVTTDRDTKPLLWMDSFGMDGKSQTEKTDWAKYSPFVYSLSPVLAYVPEYTGERLEFRMKASGFRMKPDANMKRFIACDAHMASIAVHVNQCSQCKHRVQTVHEKIQHRWGETSATSDLLQDIGLRTVRLLDHMRIWPIIERTLSMRKGRLIFPALGWKIVYSTYCLGVLSLDSVTRCLATCQLANLASDMIEVVELAVFKGIVHQLGTEAELAIPQLPLQETESVEKGIPTGRVLKRLDYVKSLQESIISGMLGEAIPVLRGQVPSVQWRGEKYDRRFLLQLADFEPNHYDTAILATAPSPSQHAKLIKRMVEGLPEEFLPNAYVRNWLDDRQATNFDWKFTIRPWYLSRMAPDMELVNGECYRGRRVSPVVVGELKEMLGNGEELDGGSERVLCPVVPLLIEKVGQKLGEDTRSELKAIPKVGGKRYQAMAVSSCSFEQRAPWKKVFLLDVVIGEYVQGCNTIPEKRLTPLFTVSLEGDLKKSGSKSTVMAWSLPGDNMHTGSLKHGDCLKKVPLILKSGKLISLLFKSETRTNFKSMPWDHIPVPFLSNKEWSGEWSANDLRLEPDVNDCFLKLM